MRRPLDTWTVLWVEFCIYSCCLGLFDHGIQPFSLVRSGHAFSSTSAAIELMLFSVPSRDFCRSPATFWLWPALWKIIKSSMIRVIQKNFFKSVTNYLQHRHFQVLFVIFSWHSSINFLHITTWGPLWLWGFCKTSAMALFLWLQSSLKK